MKKSVFLEIIDSIKLMMIIWTILAIIFTMIALPIMLFKGATAKDKFCSSQGFDSADNLELTDYCVDAKDGEIVRQSSREVICDWSFFKVDNCRWKQPVKIVEVGE